MPNTINCESNARQAGLQTNRLPTHARTVLVRLDDPTMPVWLAYYDDSKWRYLNCRIINLPILGWAELDDIAWLMDQIGNPSDS